MPSVDEYRLISLVYDLATAPFLDRIRRDAASIAQSRGVRLALDVACGTGRQAVMLRKIGIDVIGLDSSPAMLDRAGGGPGAPPLLLGLAGALPFADRTFDLCIISMALHEFADGRAEESVHEALRVLRPGGLLLAADYSAEGRGAARFNRALLAVVERAAGRRHSRQYSKFLDAGGLEGLLDRCGLNRLTRGRYFGGTVMLAEAAPPSTRT
jgi:demethylmenaquinone methyltransferase/2-methoxy-6-polyprenyl-1,4-benzoquinol methylase